MYDIEIKAGKTIRYDIWFSGEPEPDVTWERNGMGLASDDSGRVTIENFVKKGNISIYYPTLPIIVFLIHSWY